MVILHEGDGLTITTEWSGGDLHIHTSDARGISLVEEYVLVVPEGQIRRLAIALGSTTEHPSVERGLREQRKMIVSWGVRAWLERRRIASYVSD